MEPVDLSVNSRGGGHLVLTTDTSSRRRSSRSPESRKRRSSPANGIIDLRVNKSGKALFFCPCKKLHATLLNYDFTLPIVCAARKLNRNCRGEKREAKGTSLKLTSFSTNKWAKGKQMPWRLLFPCLIS